MQQENITLVRRLIEAVPKHDLQSIRECLDPQVEWIEPTAPGLYFSGVHRGMDSVLKEVIDPSYNLFDGLKLNVQQYLDARDTIIVLGQFSGRAKKTSQELNAPCAIVFTIRNNKIVKCHDFTNTIPWLQALGMWQPAARAA